jgi:hypothetical protein
MLASSLHFQKLGAVPTDAGELCDMYYTADMSAINGQIQADLISLRKNFCHTFLFHFILRVFFWSISLFHVMTLCFFFASLTRYFLFIVAYSSLFHFYLPFPSFVLFFIFTAYSFHFPLSYFPSYVFVLHSFEAFI